MHRLLVVRLEDNHKVFKILDTKENLTKEYEHYTKEFGNDKLKGLYEVTLKKVEE